MKNNNLKKNIYYNIAYQILNLLMPLVTTPYIARVIGVNGVGIYSYTYSIVQYFILFVMLGLNNYGNRTIAKSKDNINEMKRNFWNIYAVQFSCFVIVSCFYWLYIYLSENEYKIFFIIQYLYILAAGIDINWLFYGLEEFKITVTRNVIIKITLMGTIFLFVKNKEDLIVYTILMSLSTVLSNGVLWKYQKKLFGFAKPNPNEMIIHFKKNIILFIPVLAISFYNIMDKIMVGKILNVTEVGLYENAEKIINVPLNILTSIGVAMLPHTTNLIANKKENIVIDYINKTMNISLFLTIPMIVGICCIADKLVVIYLGDAFKDSIILVQFLSIVILFKIWANIIRTQYLIPKEKDKAYILSVIIGAILNVIFNTLFINSIGTIGAVYGTIIAEFFVCMIQTISVRRELPICQYMKYCCKYTFNSFFMGIILLGERYLLDKNNINKYIYICIIVLSGIAIYIILNCKSVKSIYNEIKKNNVKEGN